MANCKQHYKDLPSQLHIHAVSVATKIIMENCLGRDSGWLKEARDDSLSDEGLSFDHCLSAALFHVELVITGQGVTSFKRRMSWCTDGNKLSRVLHFNSHLTEEKTVQTREGNRCVGAACEQAEGFSGRWWTSRRTSDESVCVSIYRTWFFCGGFVFF